MKTQEKRTFLCRHKHKYNRKKLFGASSENSKYDGIEQMNLFNEAEAERTALSPEPTIETITYKRKKKKGNRETLLAQLPVETVEYTCLLYTSPSPRD